MSVSREGASLRSARTWLLLLYPEIPDRSGGNGALVEGGRCLGRSQRRHGMAYLRPPSIAAFGRSRLSAAAGRVDRGLRPPPQIARSRIDAMSVHELKHCVRTCKAAGSAPHAPPVPSVTTLQQT